MTLPLRVREVDLSVDPARYGDAFVLSETSTFEITSHGPWPAWAEVVVLVVLFLVGLLMLRLAAHQRLRAPH